MEHVAIAASKCVPSGIFRIVEHPSKLQFVLLTASNLQIIRAGIVSKQG